MKKLFTTILLAAVLCAACSKDEPVSRGNLPDGKLYISDIIFLEYDDKTQAYFERPVKSGEILVRNFRGEILGEFELSEQGSLSLDLAQFESRLYSQSIDFFINMDNTPEISYSDRYANVYPIRLSFRFPQNEITVGLRLSNAIEKDISGVDWALDAYFLYSPKNIDVLGSTSKTICNVHIKTGWNTVVFSERLDVQRFTITTENLPWDKMRWILN